MWWGVEEEENRCQSDKKGKVVEEGVSGEEGVWRQE